MSETPGAARAVLDAIRGCGCTNGYIDPDIEDWSDTQPTPCAACEQAILSALKAERAAGLAEGLRQGFRAGYHCQWVHAEGRYIFSPDLKPGDFEGAYAAWLATGGGQDQEHRKEEKRS